MSTTTITGTVPTVYPSNSGSNASCCPTAPITGGGSSNNNSTCPSSGNSSSCPTGGTSTGSSSSGKYPDVCPGSSGTNQSCSTSGGSNTGSGSSGEYPDVCPGGSGTNQSCSTSGGSNTGSGSSGEYPDVCPGSSGTNESCDSCTGGGDDSGIHTTPTTPPEVGDSCSTTCPGSGSDCESGEHTDPTTPPEVGDSCSTTCPGSGSDCESGEHTDPTNPPEVGDGCSTTCPGSGSDCESGVHKDPTNPDAGEESTTEGEYNPIPTPPVGEQSTTTVDIGDDNHANVTAPNDDTQDTPDKNKTTSDHPEDKQADPIDVFTGAHTISVGLLRLNGGQKISLVAHYNSTKRVKGNLGIGWYHNYEKRLLVTDSLIQAYDTPSTYDEFITSDGGTTFTCTASNKYGYTITGTVTGGYCLNCNSERLEEYDSDGRLIKITNHQGYITEINYFTGYTVIHDVTAERSIVLVNDATGKVVFVREYGLSGEDIIRQTELQYLNDYLVGIKDVNGNCLAYSYNSDGRIEYGIDSNNVRFFENTYDNLGRVISQKDGVGSDPTEFVYDGLTRKVTNRNGDLSIRVYNDNGQLLKYTDENGNDKEYEYDSYGNTVKEIDAKGNQIVKEYNSFNKPTKIKDKNGNETIFEYDANGNVVCIRYPGITDTETFAYDSCNRLIKHVDLRGLITVYEYTADGMPLKKVVKKSETDASPKIYLYSYTNGLLVSEADAKGNVTSYAYNMLGQVVKKTDCCGNETNFEYDLAGNVTKVTYPDESFVSYVYDCNYRKISSTDANGNVTEYSYNGNMKNTSVKLPDENIVSYEYDAEDRLIKEKDQLNNATTYTYDSAGRVISKKLPDGAETTYEYDSVGNVLKETTVAGAKIIKTYDNNGNAVTVQVQDNDGNPYNDVITSYEYDALNRIAKVTKQASSSVLNTTVYAYSPAGDVISETTTADGKVYTKSCTYDIYGNKLTETDANGNTTSYTYDVNNNVITITDALGNTTQNTYDSLNRLVQVKNARNAVVTYGYDALGRRTTVTDARGNCFTTEYDANGNVLSVTDPDGNILKESTFNCLNLPVTVTDPSAGTTTYEYNAIGKPSKITDALNNSKTLAYNSRGMNISVTEPTETTSTATYNALGKITELCGPDGGNTTYTYDVVGRLTSETTPSGGTVSYEYNAHGVMSKVTNARNQVKNINYDSIGRVVNYTSPHGVASFTYDNNGNVLTATDMRGNVTRTYDALNRVVTYKNTHDNIVQYEYDAVGNITKLTYPDNTAVCYEYDLNNNLTKVTDWANRVTTYTYDCNNRVIKTVKPDGSVTTNEYDSDQLLKSSVTRASDETVISDFEYTFDSNKRIICEKSIAKCEEIWYTYDSLSRVVQKKIINLTDNSETVETYAYSNAGNISSVNGDESFVYDTSNRLTEYNGQSISYDADGNMVSSPLGSFGYDCSNRLVNDGVCNYIYNVDGTRMSVFNWTTYRVATYTYDVNASLSRLLTVTDGGVTTKYVYGLGLISDETGTDCKIYHYDYRGSTVALTDISGNVTDRFAYDTYGKLISHTGASYTPFMYNGRDGVITERDSSLIYMRARFYSPDLRRFINADLLHGDITNSLTLNRYAYCNGDPVNGIDPFGLSKERGNSDLTGWLDWYTEDVSNTLHTILDIVGFLPPLGPIADGLNALVYALEGDWVNAGLSAFSAIPGLGDVAAGCRWLQKIVKPTGDIYKVLDSLISFIAKIEDFFDVSKGFGKVDDVIHVANKYDDAIHAVNKYGDEATGAISSAYSRIDPPDLTKMTPEEIGRWATSGTAYEKGLKGEYLAKIRQEDKVRIGFNKYYRVPDAYKEGEYILEVKNVARLSYTKQLRDFAAYADDRGISKILYVRPDTKLSPELLKAGWEIRRLW